MVSVRSRKLKTGTFHYVITGRHTPPIPCGAGPEAKEYAQSVAADLRKARRDARAGRPVEIRCSWSIEDLRDAHLEDARRRGLRTALPQLDGRQSKLQSHWNNLLRFFSLEESIDRITSKRIREYISFRESRPAKKRERPAGPVPINQDLFAILKPALAIARARVEAGYRGDPFAGLKPLAARRKREPIALTTQNLEKIVRTCWERHPPLGAYVELLKETASRLNEVPHVAGGLLRYPAYKRGRPRAFRLEGRLPELVRAPRAFDRHLWKEAVATAGVPAFNPHDVRHSALTILGKRPGMSLLALQNYGGWQSPAMAQKYLHPGAAAISPLSGRAKSRHGASQATKAKRA